MTIADLLRRVLDADCMRVQLLHECVLGARAVKGRKDTPAHTRVEFATTNMTPNDLMYFVGGRPDSRLPAWVGIVVWVPVDRYQEWVKQ